MKRYFSAALCSVTAILICVYILMTGNADWLTIETPSYAVPGTNFIVKVKLINPEQGLMLGVDLHHMDNEKNTRGCFSVGRPLEIKDNESVYYFSVPVPCRGNTSYIFPVITLSKDGSWSGRVKAAESEPVPVQLSGQVPDRIILMQRKTRDTGEKVSRIIHESDILSFVTAALWAAFAVMLLIKRNMHFSPLLTLTSAVSAVWEGSGSSTAIALYLRGIALHAGAYSLRREPQQILTFIIILACAAVIIYLFSVFHKSHITIILICFTIFWSISLLRIFSLHEIDRILTLTIAGIQTGQLIRLACAVLSATTFLHIIINSRREI